MKKKSPKQQPVKKVAVKKPATTKPVIAQKPPTKKVKIASAPLVEQVKTVEQTPVEQTPIPVVPEIVAPKPIEVAHVVEMKDGVPVVTGTAYQVKTQKVAAHAEDVAAGDKAAPGRFEVLVGGTKVGEVAFRSVVKMKDGAPAGFRHFWQAQDVRGKVVFTDGKRMKDMVEQLASTCMGGAAKTPAPAKDDETTALAAALVTALVPTEAPATEGAA